MLSELEKRQAALEELLGGLSDLAVREMCLEALRAWHRERPLERDFSMHGELASRLLPIVSARRGVSVDDSLKELFVGPNPLNQPWMASIREFMVWVERAGIAHPLGARVNDFPIHFMLTRAGARLLAGPADHPLLPGFAHRLASRCPGLPPDVLSLLADAQACLDQGLMRPSVVLMGVAYEVAIEHIVETLVQRGALPAAAQNDRAAARINRLRGELLVLLPGNINLDARNASAQALDFADALRSRRNDASHTQPTYGFEDREEVEELLVSGGRHLPNLWRLLRRV